MSMTDEQRAAVVAEAISWERTPWRHMARVKGAGVDCGIYVLEVFERCGLIPHYEPEPYPHDWHMHRSEERYLKVVERFCVPTVEALPGDIVTFRWGHCVSHGAIVISWPEVIHAYVDHGVIRDDVVHNRVLAKRLAGMYTLRNTT